jgi:peptidoglycan/LPS O-acetylase OafA/YrhL
MSAGQVSGTLIGPAATSSHAVAVLTDAAQLREPTAPATAAAKPSGRFVALDGLRGIAALLVVFFHIGWPNHFTPTNFVRNGYLAVDLFFILSGLVIYANYGVRINQFADFVRFLGLRFFRVYPLLIAMLGLFVLLESAKMVAQQKFGIVAGQPPFTGADTADTLLANIFLLQGLHVLPRLTWNTPSWSISCEFLAYVLFSALVLTGLARHRLFPPVAAVTAATLYVGVAYGWGTLDVTYDWGILRCVAGFLLGMVIYRARDDIQSINWQGLAGAGEVVLLILLIATLSFASGATLVMSVAVFVGLVALLQFDHGPIAWILMSRPAQFLGRVSYSIYMVHLVLLICMSIIVKRLFGVTVAINPATQSPTFAIGLWPGDLLAFAAVVCVLATASVTYAVIEAPARRFGRMVLGASVKTDARLSSRRRAPL